MATRAAFLRAVNVGGRRVTNDELRALVEEAGVGDVATYRASGNLLLTVDESSASCVRPCRSRSWTSCGGCCSTRTGS